MTLLAEADPLYDLLGIDADAPPEISPTTFWTGFTVGTGGFISFAVVGAGFSLFVAARGSHDLERP
ncbi:hypothetical protein KEM60_00663 [Austwickia sp. TVS 96-490-7B]|nr:hypothetical protein [Austwickia sp. TVS 96-490-7B]